MKTLILAVLDLYRPAARRALPAARLPLLPQLRRLRARGFFATRRPERSAADRAAPRARCHPFDPGGLDAVPVSSPVNPPMDRNLWLAVALSARRLSRLVRLLRQEGQSAARDPRALCADRRRPFSTSAPGVRGRISAAPGRPLRAQDPESSVLAHSDAIKLGDADALVAPRGAALASFSFQGPISRVELVADPSEGLFATFPELAFKRDLSSEAPSAVYAATRPDGRQDHQGIRARPRHRPAHGLSSTTSNPGRARRSSVRVPWSLTAGPGLGTPSESARKKDNAEGITRVVGLTIPRRHEQDTSTTLKPGAHPAPYQWLAVDNRYFLAALLPSFDALRARLRAIAPPMR